MTSASRPMLKPLVLALCPGRRGPGARVPVRHGHRAESQPRHHRFLWHFGARQRPRFRPRRHRQRRHAAFGERGRRQPLLRQEQALRQHRQGHRRPRAQVAQLRVLRARNGVLRLDHHEEGPVGRHRQGSPGQGLRRPRRLLLCVVRAGRQEPAPARRPPGDQLGREHVPAERHQRGQPGGCLEAARSGFRAQGGLPAHRRAVGQHGAHQEPERGRLLPHQPRQDQHRPARDVFLQQRLRLGRRHPRHRRLRPPQRPEQAAVQPAAPEHAADRRDRAGSLRPVRPGRLGVGAALSRIATRTTTGNTASPCAC